MTRWNDNYTTGIEKLNKERQQLSQVADQVLNKLRERGDEASYRILPVWETLTYITSYFERHAKAEEEYMHKTGHTGYTLHKMLHNRFCNIQPKECQDIVKRGECSKEEIQDFVGNGIEWLLEHIATADMAIIGEGILAAPAKNSDFEARLEEKINTLLTISLSIVANVKIIGRSYQGEFLGKTVYQRMIYSLDSREVIATSGIENLFLPRAAEMIYGIEVKNEMDLILSSLRLFVVNFWRSIGQRFIGSDTMMTTESNSFVTAGFPLEELGKLKLAYSLLFAFDVGKFSMVVNYREFQKHDRVAVSFHGESEWEVAETTTSARSRYQTALDMSNKASRSESIFSLYVPC